VTSECDGPSGQSRECRIPTGMSCARWTTAVARVAWGAGRISAGTDVAATVHLDHLVQVWDVEPGGQHVRADHSHSECRANAGG
jgi:hypothetical protein